MSGSPSSNRRTGVLTAIVLALLVVVLWVQLGPGGGVVAGAKSKPSAPRVAGQASSGVGVASDASSEAPQGDLHDVYTQQLQAVRRERQIASAGESWEQARDRLRSQWDEVRRQFVKGKTLELAQAGFRERVLSETKDFKFLQVKANVAPIEGPAEDAATAAMPVKVIGLRVEVDSDNPDDLYRLVDRLENMPDARAEVTAVKLEGPGFKLVPGRLAAVIQVRSLALVGED